ncbi:MAG TPA: AAA domain-containing protein, partial [Firmicutes bacterium]|nr:AAA domain-containing protein [Candidatus Fermentithermobacillaceae bacterium]
MDEIAVVRSSMAQVIVGKSQAIDLLLTAFLSEGHVLIEDVPGVGKTLLAKTFAHCMGLSFRRIQFTPDLLPADVTGTSIFNQKTLDFEFRPGPVFADIILADEINRATPRTQSSLLECMEERQVTVDGSTYPLSSNFMVLATQNPVELSGTFPLPEAQMDRFLMRIRMGYPSKE